MRLERSQTRVVEKEAKGEGNGDKALHGVKGTKLTRREVLKAAGTGLGGLFILPSCGSGGQQGGSSDTITFGAALSLTGELAKEGKLTRDGYNFYKEWINAHNGIKADGKSYKVDVKVYDDQSDPNQAAQLYQRLITQDDIKFLLGPYGSSATLQSAVISEKHKLPMVEANGASTEIFQQGYKYIFGVLSPAPKYLQPVLDVAANQTGSNAPKSVALIADNDSFSLDVSKGARDYAKSKGFEVVADETVPEGANDVTAVLTGVKRQKPDILLGSGHFSSSVLIIKSARSVGLNAKMYGFSVGPSVPDFDNSLGKAANYVFGATQWTADLDYEDPLFGTAKEYSDNFQKSFDYAPDYHVAESTAGCYALQLAIEKANSLDPKEVRDALVGLDAQTFYGQIKFDESGKNIYKPMAAEQWQGDKKVTVWPEASAPAPAKYPTPPWNQR